MSYLEKLSFGHVVHINDFILEVIPHQGIEINRSHVEEYHRLIREQKKPVGVLFNRSYGFSYTFDALQQLITNPAIVALAFLATERYAFTITENDISLILNQHKPIDVFYDKLIATLWLNMLRTRLPHEQEFFSGRDHRTKPRYRFEKET